jgi:hypothetical protein
MVLTVSLILTFAELAMRFLVCHPNLLRQMSRKLQNSISYLYVQGERKVMQYLEGCGRYSPDLGYTLKPGKFTFTEIEFSNDYFINSLGVRDTEDVLHGPEIIFLGDSYALGWGVNQDETFPALIGKKTNLKTLNTSVPSFGTVREMLMLRKIDRSKLKCLIIQYCGDDYDENLRYYQNGNRPQIMREETFRKLMAIPGRPKKYFFGKYLWMKIKKKAKEWRPSFSSVTDRLHLSDADLFLHVLKQNEDILKTLPIIVFEMNGKDQLNYFTGELKQKAIDNNNPSFIRNLIVLDMSQYLCDKNFYVLDSHLNVDGNIIAADVLYNKLRDIKII